MRVSSWIRGGLCVLLVSGLACRQETDPPLSVSASLVPARLIRGESTLLVVTAATGHRGGRAEILFEPGEYLGGFLVTEVRRVKSGVGEGHQQFRIKLASVRTGLHRIDPIPIRWVPGAGEVGLVLRTPALVADVRPEGASPSPPLLAPEVLDPEGAATLSRIDPAVWWGGLVAGALCLFLAVIWTGRRRQSGASSPRIGDAAPARVGTLERGSGASDIREGYRTLDREFRDRIGQLGGLCDPSRPLPELLRDSGFSGSGKRLVGRIEQARFSPRVLDREGFESDRRRLDRWGSSRDGSTELEDPA